MRKDQLLRDCEELSADWLEALEQAKQLYLQYAEVSELYKLPKVREVKIVYHQPPSVEHPLTTNIFRDAEFRKIDCHQLGQTVG